MGRSRKDVTIGIRYGCLEVLSDAGVIKGNSHWNVKCHRCGHQYAVRVSKFNTNKTACVKCYYTVRTPRPKKPRQQVIALQKIRDEAARRATAIGTLKYLDTQIKSRAKRKGLEHDLTYEWLEELYHKQGGVCARTGAVLAASSPHRASRASANTISVDRVDSTSGYTKDNVELVTCICNTAKNAYSHKELLEFCKAYVSNAENNISEGGA